MKGKSKQANQSVWKNIYYFFPSRLLLGQFKTNHLFILMWVFPFLIITHAFGVKFGVPSLFLAPEYMGHQNGFSFLFMGLATGSFIMAYHLSSYVVMAHRYPFIVTVSKPFYVYSLNNSLIPVAYLLLYLYQSYRFQIGYEMISGNEALANLSAFLLGNVLFIYFSFGFFYLVARTIPSVFHVFENNIKRFDKYHWIEKFFEKDKNIKIKEAPIRENEKGGVETYIRSFLRVARTGRFHHYSKEAFTHVFYYQHRNALLYALFILFAVLIRGLFKDQPSLILPAGASLQLMLTIIILLSSLLYILFQRWTFVAVTLLLVIAGFTAPFAISSYNNNAYGLQYPKNPVPVINPLNHGNFRSDSLKTVQILNRWLQKNLDPQHPEKKPQLVVVSTSGGGLKMAVWTYYALAYADSCLHGELLKHTELMTGASGGMLGAAYLRELYLQKQKTKANFQPSGQRVKNLSKDILNPVFYTFSMSDWFFRLQTFSYQSKTYYKDRAYIFEQTLNRNLGTLLDKPLYAYRKPEEKATIPLLILTPTIENMGTQLIISPIDVSYLTKREPKEIIRNVEFRHQYAAFGADSLRFLSAIRMNASFPYVSPDVALPGKPRLVVMDAGLNDNFGYVTAFHFIVTFSTWIKRHTSGIILLELHENDTPDVYHLHANLGYRLMRPMGSLFDDWAYVQKSNYQEMLASLDKLLPGKFQQLRLTFGSSKNHISLSWHLTKKEKQILMKAIHNTDNQKSIKRLHTLLE